MPIAQKRREKKRVDYHPADGQSLPVVRLGVLLDERMQEQWVLDSLRRILSMPGTQLSAIAVTGSLCRKSFATRLHRLLDGLDKQLRCRYERLFVLVDIVAGLAAPMFDIGVVSNSDGWCPDEAGLGTLRRCDVDVWLCFSAIPPRRSLPPVSRLGVWGIEIGRNVSATSIWAGAAEVDAGSPVTLVGIVDYAKPGNGLIYSSFSATVKNSVRRNRLNSLCKGMHFFRRLLESQKHNGATCRPAQAVTLSLPAQYPESREPTVSALARLSFRLISNVAANQLHLLRWRDQWQIAYYFKDESDKLGCRFERMRYLIPPRDCFWADPFAVEYQGRYFIFFEELPYHTQKGRIMVMEVFENAEPGAAQVALERPYHLSYPFIFAWNGSMYMLPETAGNGTIEVFRSEAFPLRWRLHRVLLDNVSAFDTTLWEENGRWWMFVNIAEPGADSCDELHLYSSTTPLGPWTARRGNPVISDVRCARSAGPLFMSQGNLYRPSQDCSQDYGHSVLINRVDALNDGDYRETTVRRIAPGWRKDIFRTHTFGGSKHLRVIDYLVSR
ncbi:MAG: hypothetical protein HY066_14510 [Betaproteobacteria bacterium]|nr:hypothetical protein [Betaproteobacteria bacterium]